MNPTKEEEEAMDGIQWDDGSVRLTIVLHIVYTLHCIYYFSVRCMVERGSCTTKEEAALLHFRLLYN